MRRRRVAANPISSTTAPIAMRCQAMSSGPRSVRSATILPLTPEVPQHSAARTTSRNPRRDVDGAAGRTGEDMTLLGSVPGRDGSGARRDGGAGQAAGLEGESARGAPGQERGGGRTRACRGVMAVRVAGAVVVPLADSSTV